MRVLWICALPLEVQQTALGNKGHGAQVPVSWILAHLPPPAANIELHIACLWPGGDRRKNVDYFGARVHLLPCPRRGRALLLFQRDTSYFRGLFDELQPAIVHGWGTEDSFGLVARRLAPAHHVIEIQGLISAYRKRAPMPLRAFLTALTERWTLAGAANVIGESNYSIEEARPLCPADARLWLIEHPLRAEFLAAAPSDRIRKTALFVGTIEERKGISEALTAFARVAPRNWKLQIVGAGSQTEERAMHRLAKNLMLEGRFQHTRFCGTGDLVQMMQTSSIFLLPTHIDTGPTALKEALTMGLWPVCYDNSGPAEYVRRYGFGSLAQDNDVESLMEQLARALKHAPWNNGSDPAALANRTRDDFSPAKAWSSLGECYKAIAVS
jgi:glycosyltransferase involved in cell wall biosynthesis